MKRFFASLLLVVILTSFVMPVFGAEQATTPSGLTFTQMEQEIARLMDEHIGITVPGAAVVIVHEGEILLSRGFGFSDIENQTPIDPATTLFLYASVNKPFVWVSVMQLAEQGLMTLDGDITNYLPPSFAFEKPLTMRDLMNHTGGFAEVVMGVTIHTDPIPTLEYTLLATQPNQIFTPGEVSAYSNWGSALAAMAVAHVSGREYATFERDGVLLPTGMQNTLNLPYWMNNTAFLADIANGYNGGNGNFNHQPIVYRVTPYPAGGMIGTAEDLAHFIKALTPPAGQSGELFTNPQTLQTLFSSSSPDPANRPTPHHGFMPQRGAYPAFGHGGNRPGFSANLTIVPELRFGFAILTNVSGESNLITALSQLLLGEPPASSYYNAVIPNAEAFEGRFITARRTYGDFMDVLSHAGLMTPLADIIALDANTIQFSLEGWGSATYRQIAPHIFTLYDASEAPFVGQVFPQLHFRMEDGVAVQIMDAGGFDYTIRPEGRTTGILVASLIAYIVGGGFFLLAPIVMFVVFIIRRKKRKPSTHFDRFQIGMMLAGTAMTINSTIEPLLFAFNSNRTLAEMSIYIWLNWIFVGLMLLSLAGGIWQWKSKEGSKILFITTAIISAMFIVLLQNWNFFTFL